MQLKALFQGRCDVIQHGLGEAGVYADPEGAIHDDVTLGERPGHTMDHVLEGRLPQQIAAEKETGADLPGFEVPDQDLPRDG